MNQKELLFQNACLIDGTGAPARRGDLLVRGERIAEIAPRIDAPEAEHIDARGKILAPGFIDLHRHCDFSALTPGFGGPELAQGITTVLSGVCGMSAFPQTQERQREYEEYLYPCLGENTSGIAFESLSQYHDRLKKAELPLNLGTFAGAGAVKIYSRGFTSGAFSDQEMEIAVRQVKDAMDEGAFGLSLGIMYTPECYSATQEIVRMASPVRGRGILCAHIRGEGDTLVQSVREAIEIARRAQTPLQISHFKSFGVRNWHNSIFRAMEEIEKARAAGQDVTADFYPYCAGSTILFSIIPPQFLTGGKAQALQFLATEAGKRRLAESLSTEVPGWDSAVLQLGLDRILISSVQKEEHKRFLGKSIAENCRELGVSEPAWWIADLLASEEGRVGILLNSMAQEDVDTVARLPYSMLISDSLYCPGGLPHPRLYGSFPRFLQEYCVRRKVLSLETAISKMTGLPARRAGIRDRGELRPHAYADLALFDQENFKDAATYENPVQPATGLDLVLVNGEIARQPGGGLPVCGGKILKKNAQ